jgi:hypothetical protein
MPICEGIGEETKRHEKIPITQNVVFLNFIKKGWDKTL